VKVFCEIAAKTIIPALRALLALTLIEKYNMTQIEAARRLGISQPAISYYVHSKRGKTAISMLKDNEEVMKLIEKAAKDIYEGKNMNAALYLCTICRIIQRNDELMRDIRNERGSI